MLLESKQQKSISLLFKVLILGVSLVNCHERHELPEAKYVRFAFDVNVPGDDSGGRTDDQVELAGVLVTIHDSNGSIIADQRKIDLHIFGDAYLSVPLTLVTTSGGKYYLTEFFVIDADQRVRYATPREGSSLAHLVDKPLDIEFGINKNEIATVTPEVLEVDDASIPSDYGYGQFGFDVIKKIEVIFSSFIKGATNFELTESHLKVEALNVSSLDTTVSWTYETDLEAKANVISLREITAYRITANKPGYKQWQETSALIDGDRLEIFLDKNSELEFQKVWNRNLGGTMYDGNSKTIVTSDGGVLSIGVSRSNNYDVTGALGGSDAWVTKLDAYGNLEWSKNYGTNGTDEGRSVSEYSDASGYLITGFTAGNGTVYGWIKKISNIGNVLWEKTTGAMLYTSSMAVEGGNFLLAAHTGLSSPVTSTSLRKIDGYGNLVWEKTIGEVGYGRMLKTKIANEYLITFQTKVVKMDVQGSVVWKATPDSLSPDGGQLTAITETVDGNLLVTGLEYYTEIVDSITLHTSKPYIYKLNGNGEFIWKRSLNSTQGHQHYIMDITLRGSNYLMVGYSDRTIPNNIVNMVQEAWVVEIAQDGNEVGRKYLGGIPPNSGYNSSELSYVIPAGSDFIIAGYTNDRAGKDVPGTYGQGDRWILKIRF